MSDKDNSPPSTKLEDDLFGDDVNVIPQSTAVDAPEPSKPENKYNEQAAYSPSNPALSANDINPNNSSGNNEPSIKDENDYQPGEHVHEDNQEEPEVNEDPHGLDPNDPNYEKMKAHHQEMDAIIANLRPKRRRKKLTHEEEIIEEEQMEFKANDLVSKMVKAALDDLKLAMNHKFPIQKLNMLDEVEKKFSKINNADQFEAYCEVNLLGAVRSWLEPLGDGQLPPYHLIQKMLEFLNKMPIRTEHLETSYIGRIVFFYSKCKRTDVKIQRMADKLYMKWCRPILNISDDFRTSAKVLEFQNRGTSEGRGGLAAGAARKVKLSEFHKSLHKRLGQLGVKKAKGRAKSNLH